MAKGETEVEKPSATGAAMEITVSRQELVKELTATQSVVERKTTIPILSNFLIEAEGDRLNITATDLDQAIRLNPVGEGGVYGRAGLLAHPYMLGPNGDSNGCVSVKDYDAFLRAYENGQIRKLAVVSSL